MLADEMGMGKTIQTIATIVADVVKHRDARKKGKKRKTADAGSNGPGPTLVVAPSSAMLQWSDEIRRATSADALKVLPVVSSLVPYARCGISRCRSSTLVCSNAVSIAGNIDGIVPRLLCREGG